MLHTLSFRNFSHFCVVQTAFAMDAGIGKIAVHAVDLRQVCAAALWADVHFQLLIAAVITVGERKVDALIKPHLHGAADERADGFFVVADRIADILDLAAVGEVPEAGFAVLLRRAFRKWHRDYLLLF